MGNGNRLLVEGTDASFETVSGQLAEGEVLVATWLRDGVMIPNARPVTDKGDYDTIVVRTKATYYVQLRFFASKTGSTDYYAYNHG